jgi:uncharacterized protein YidB (DUF937 family)
LRRLTILNSIKLEGNNTVNITETAAQLLSKTLGLSVDAETIASGLKSLLGENGDNIDLAGIASRMASNGNLGGILESWLGDGGNASIGADDILALFGEDKLGDFASKVGTDTQSAASGLADVLPQVMDKASSGGSLLDSVGGAKGLFGAAKSFLS